MTKLFLCDIINADYYVEAHFVYKDEESGYMEGPHMNSGFAGSSYAGWGISSFERALAEERYEQLGQQAIVVK